MSRRRALLLLWLLTDIALFIAAYAAAYFARVGWILSSDLPFLKFLAVVAAVSPLWIGALVTTRTFGLTRSQATPRNVAYIAWACAVGAALVALTYYFVAAQVFSRLILVGGLAGSAVVITLWHLVFERFMRASLWNEPAAFPTLIVGVTRESKVLVELLVAKRSPLKPVGILDAAGAKEKEIAGVPVLGKLNTLEEVLRGKKITHLIQCSDLEQTINLLSACRERGISYLLLPSVLGIVERDERVESLEGRSVTVISPKHGFVDWLFR